MGKSTIQMTILASVVLFLVGGMQIFAGVKREGGTRVLLLSLGTAVLLCIPASLLLKVRDYRVTESHVVVRYGLTTRSFQLSDIQSPRVHPKALSGGMRDAGNGGLWSFLGWFSNRELGKIRAFVSDTEKTVVMRMPDFALVISPDDPAAFVNAVNREKGGQQG